MFRHARSIATVATQRLYKPKIDVHQAKQIISDNIGLYDRVTRKYDVSQTRLVYIPVTTNANNFNVKSDFNVKYWDENDNDWITDNNIRNVKYHEDQVMVYTGTDFSDIFSNEDPNIMQLVKHDYAVNDETRINHDDNINVDDVPKYMSFGIKDEKMSNVIGQEQNKWSNINATHQYKKKDNVGAVVIDDHKVVSIKPSIDMIDKHVPVYICGEYPDYYIVSGEGHNCIHDTGNIIGNRIVDGIVIGTMTVGGILIGGGILAGGTYVLGNVLYTSAMGLGMMVHDMPFLLLFFAWLIFF
jgi:hypothetical protein